METSSPTKAATFCVRPWYTNRLLSLLLLSAILWPRWGPATNTLSSLLPPALFDLTSHLDPLLCGCVRRQVSSSVLLLEGEELAAGGSVTSAMLHGGVSHSKLLHCVSKQNPRGEAGLPDHRPFSLLWVESP